jgi:hypothetical protein
MKRTRSTHAVASGRCRLTRVVGARSTGLFPESWLHALSLWQGRDDPRRYWRCKRSRKAQQRRGLPHRQRISECKKFLCPSGMWGAWGLISPYGNSLSGRCGASHLFQPDPVEASRRTKSYKVSSVFNCALSDKDGSATLYITREPGCSSLLRPLNLLEIVDRQTVPPRAPIRS